MWVGAVNSAQIKLFYYKKLWLYINKFQNVRFDSIFEPSSVWTSHDNIKKLNYYNFVYRIETHCYIQCFLFWLQLWNEIHP